MDRIEEINIRIESITKNMQEVWISCPKCSISFKELVILNEDYSETELCNYCRSLCEYCEDKKSLVDNNLCGSCQSNLSSNDLNDTVLLDMPVSSRLTNSSKHNTDSETQEVQNNSNKLINIVTVSASSNDSNYNELEFYELQDSNASIDADDDLETEVDKSSNLQLLKSIDKVCISHPINSVNAPINGTLGNRSIEEIVEGLGDLLNKDSVILDLGSGNGKTALKFAVSVGSTAVGIEYDKLRFQGSMVNLVAAMKKFEVKAFFINGDIDTYFETFNGYDIIYMFDTAFTTNTINKIKDAFNRSTTVKAIVCNNILDSIGYDVSLFKCLGSLSAENINRNFYIFKANAFSCSNGAIDEINQIDINKAKYLEQRSNEALLVKTNFLNQTRNMLSVDHCDSKELYDMLQQSPVSINGIMFSRSNEAAGETGRKSCYVLFNRQDLSLLNRFEYKAIQLTSKYLGFITPAYGNNGEILISIIYYACGPVYEAVIYNIRSKSLRKITAKELFGSNLHFNYKNALPDDVDMISVMSIYREKYPIKELIKKVIHVEADEDLEPEDLKLILPTKRKASNLVISNKVLKIQTVDLTESSKQSKSKKVKEDSLAKLQEENRLLKRRHEELEKELTKKSKLDNNKATTDLIRETKESERLMKAKDNEIIKLKKEQEREINQIKTNQERQINEMKTNEDRKINEIKSNQDRQISEMKSYEEKERKLLERQLHDNMIEREIMKSKCAEESTRSELMKLAAVNEQIIIELKKEREVRDADRKEYNQVTTKLYDRIIETHENNNNNNRADTKGYFDKILDLANNVISKLTKEV